MKIAESRYLLLPDLLYSQSSLTPTPLPLPYLSYSQIYITTISLNPRSFSFPDFFYPQTSLTPTSLSVPDASHLLSFTPRYSLLPCISSLLFPEPSFSQISLTLDINYVLNSSHFFRCSSLHIKSTFLSIRF